MKLLVILILIISLIACVNSQYQDYTSGIVISAIEYDKKPHSLRCGGEFKCEKETIECVYYFYETAQNHIDEAKLLIKSRSETIPVVTEFYNALCNLYQVKTYLKILEEENKDDWDILERVGLIRQTDLAALILAVRIRKLELEDRREECNETDSCPNPNF